MFRNYFTIAFRNLVKHKLFTGLNTFGLATGMACSILIFLWVQDERSYDKFNTNADQIYRLTVRISGIDAAVSPVPIAMALKKEIPAVKNVTRLVALQTVVTVDNKKFEENHIYYADSNLLQMFTYPVLQGDDAASLLKRPDGIVITENTAKRYFGDAGRAIGKTVIVGNTIAGTNMVVTAVLKDLPANSHLKFDILMPIKQYEGFINQKEAWGNYDVYTYLQLDKEFKATSTALHSLKNQMELIQKKNDNTHTASNLFLQKLTDIHLHSHLLLDVEGNGNAQHVTIFSLVALFILLIACINFMNLSTALSGQRAKEVGLRKTVGALRIQLIIQFICESVLLSFIALIIGLAIASLLLPLFNELAAKSITLELANVKMLLTLLGIAVLTGLIAGSYPALFLSSFQPVKVIKGVKALHGRKTFFRNGLVVVQFSISVILMASTLVVYKQLQFIRDRDMGYNKENLLYVPIPMAGDIGKNTMALKAAFNQSAATSSYTVVSHLPTYLTTGTTAVQWTVKDPNTQIVFPEIWVDDNFINIFGMQLLAGRFFSKDFQGDENNYVLNETCLRTMKIDLAQAIGQKITVSGKPGEIIGVVKDFNFKPIQQPIEPIIIKNGARPNYHSNAHYIVLKTAPANLQQTLAQLKNIYHNALADHPFSFGFVDDDLSKLYLAEQRMGKLFNVFSLLSIIVSCLGLFGLATFATQKRIREIGIRKVLGATAAGIVGMLSKDFVRLVMASLIIAFPVAWWAMNAWLDNFAYRISLSWWMFALAGTLALLIAFITVSYQSIKAALSNPAKSLKNE